MNHTTEQKIICAAMECGAFGAACLCTDQIILDVQFRQICQSNGCGRYGKCYQCPPDLGDIEALMKNVRGYSKAVFYQSVAPLEDSFDFEGMMDAAAEHTQLSQRIQEKLADLHMDRYLHLSSACRLCQRCAKEENLPCRYPDKALGPVEGYAIDVYKTIQNTDLKYTNGENTVTFFGAVLFSA